MDGWTQSDLVTERWRSPLSCTGMLTKVEVPSMDTFLSALTSCRIRIMQLVQDDSLIQIVPVVLCLLIFGAQMIIFVIIKVNIKVMIVSCSSSGHIGLPNHVDH